jgi:hypothetical protein
VDFTLPEDLRDYLAELDEFIPARPTVALAAAD